MYAAFRSVHATAVGAQAVVKQFARCKSKNRTLSCLKYKGRNGSTILPEVKHQCLAGTDSHRLPGGITAENVHATVMRFVSLLYSAPDVCRLGCQSQVVAQIDLCTFRGKYIACKLMIEFRYAKFSRSIIAHRNTGVVLLTIKDSSVCHRPGYACTPTDSICSDKLLRAICELQPQHSTERTFAAIHTLCTCRGDDLVSPPTRCNLRGQDIRAAGCKMHGIGYIVRKRAFGFGIMGEAGFEELIAYRLCIDVQLIDAQSCGHPRGRGYLLIGRQRAHKPVGTVSGTATVLNNLCADRCISHRYPLGGVPSIVW